MVKVVTQIPLKLKQCDKQKASDIRWLSYFFVGRISQNKNPVSYWV